MKENITVPTGTVVGIGKIKVFTTENFKKVIPTLSFIVAEQEGRFTGTCIPLCLDCSADSTKEVCDKLSNLCEEFLSDLFGYNSENAWNQLHELFNSEAGNDFRKAYYDVQLNLAEKGISYTSDMEDYLSKRLEEAEEELQLYKQGLKKQIYADVVSFEKLVA